MKYKSIKAMQGIIHIKGGPGDCFASAIAYEKIPPYNKAYKWLDGLGENWRSECRTFSPSPYGVLSNKCTCENCLAELDIFWREFHAYRERCKSKGRAARFSRVVHRNMRDKGKKEER